MLTIFTIPKPFKEGHINIIQRNAIKSWLKLTPKCQIILFGDDEGVAEAAREFNVLHIPNVKKTEFGTPLLDDVFNSARKLADNDFLVYVNADIIFLGGDGILKALQSINFPSFLMAGRRWDLDIEDEIKFNEAGWENKMRDLIAQKGVLHGFSGMDYFIFPKNLQHNILSFAVGRPGWDSWLVYHMRASRIPVIDATKAITIVHQNHNYSHSIWGKKKRVEGPETKKNIKLAGGFANMCTLRDADWILTKDGLRRPPYPRRIFAELTLFYPWRLFSALKRKLQQ
jgi:hypothetical protein